MNSTALLMAWIVSENGTHSGQILMDTLGLAPPKSSLNVYLRAAERRFYAGYIC